MATKPLRLLKRGAGAEAGAEGGAEGEHGGGQMVVR